MGHGSTKVEHISQVLTPGGLSKCWKINLMIHVTHFINAYICFLVLEKVNFIENVCIVLLCFF